MAPKAPKEFTFDTTRASNSAASSPSKLPIDTAGAGKALTSFQEIPVERLHPCTLKGTSDYSKHGSLLHEQMVESIKEYGVLEVLTVRKSPVEMSKYEILAGERRWESAKAAGQKTVPCHIVDLDDAAARSVFHLTNLMRRDLTPRDKIYGWYNYYTQIKGDSNPEENLDAEVTKAIAQEQEGVAALVGGKSISLRMIQHYVKMHNLIDPWLDRLDAEKVTGRIAYQIAFLPKEAQEQLLEYKVTEPKVSWLHKVYAGKLEQKWYDNIIPDHFEKESVSEEVVNNTPVVLTEEEKAELKKTKELNRRFKKALPKITTSIKAQLRPSDYDRADEVIEKALALYYQQEESD